MPLLVCLGQSGQVMAPRQRWRVMHLHPLLDLTLDDGKKKPLLGCSSMHKVLYPFFNSGEPPWRTFPILIYELWGCLLVTYVYQSQYSINILAYSL